MGDKVDNVIPKLGVFHVRDSEIIFLPIIAKVTVKKSPVRRIGTSPHILRKVVKGDFNSVIRRIFSGIGGKEIPPLEQASPESVVVKWFLNQVLVFDGFNRSYENGKDVKDDKRADKLLS